MTKSARYVQAAVAGEEKRVIKALKGGRNRALFVAACALGSLVGAGVLPVEEAWNRLFSAGKRAGLKQHEVFSTLRSGLRQGAEQPRRAPGGPRLAGNTPLWSLSSLWSQVPSRAKPRWKRPPDGEILQIWAYCTPVTADRAVSAWLRHRGLDPEAIEAWNSARVLPGGSLPDWTRTKAGWWSQTGHRLILPLRGATGELESLRARSILPESSLKAVSPWGYQVSGLVLADFAATEILAGRTPVWWKGDLAIVEGEPDFLTWVHLQRDSNEDGPAIVGVFSGSWSDEIARRIPDGTRVVVRVHHDAAGDKYATQIVKTLRSRCTLLRSRP